jgi:hypothetical protein
VESNKFLNVLAAIFGVLGVVICIAAILVVFFFTARLDRANEVVFGIVDNSFVAVRERVVGAQEAIQEAAITTGDIRQGLTDVARKETGERLASRLQIEKTTEKLARGLDQADVWLEMSDASIQSIQQILVMGKSLGAPVDTEFVAPLLEKLNALRVRLKETTDAVDDISQRAAGIKEDEPINERVEQALELLVRVVATLTELDSRLGESADKLAELQADGQQLKARTDWYILLAKLGSYLLIAWMAVGQVFMCRYGAKQLRLDQSKA